MRNALKTTFVSLAMLASAAALQRANAADLGYRKQSSSYLPTMAAVNWGGMYGGLHVGYGSGRARNADTNGFIGGAQLGFNIQADKLVFGAEADIHYTGIDYHGFTDAFRQKWAGSLRGRIGYAYDRFLPFLTAGVGFTSAHMKAGGAKDDNVHAGYILGAGAEYMFTDRVSGVVQYLHRRDGAKTYSVLPASRSTTMVTNEIRIGINYHF